MEADKLENKKIAFIGSGHIATAFVEGFLKSNSLQSQNIVVSSPDEIKLLDLEKKLNIKTEKNNVKAVSESEMVFICVKPDVALLVSEELSQNVADKLVISLAAGVTLKALEKRLGKDAKIFRVMPNIPIASNCGVLGILPNQNVTKGDKRIIESLLKLVGRCFWLKNDNEINVFTIISGCGPALVANFIHMVQKSAESLGLDEKQAQLLALENFISACSYLKAKEETPIELINSVATKGGVTAEIIDSMKTKKIGESVVESLNNGMKKIKNLEIGLDQ